MTSSLGLTLADVEIYLNARGFRDAQTGYPDAKIVRGTGSAEDIKKVGPGRGVVLSRGGGPGLIYEWAFDQPILTARVIGKQNDYDDGEQMAFAFDRLVLADSNVIVGSAQALYLTRAGGGPTCIQVDTARRSHWSCSYIVPVASGL